jgi:hypothetical protein
MRLRRELIAVPLACLLMAWVLKAIEPACSWQDVMDALHVKHQAQYSRLALLGCTLVGIVAILRILRQDKDD